MGQVDIGLFVMEMRPKDHVIYVTLLTAFRMNPFNPLNPYITYPGCLQMLLEKDTVHL